MKIPKRIQPLVDDGLVDEVIRRLKSGKEADVYVVRCGQDIRCAKVYKEAENRSFKQAVQYQEGRKVRNSRDARAMAKGSKFGRKQQEETWQTAEVDALYLLANAGVRVPQPYACLDGVLLMELVTDANGDVTFTTVFPACYSGRWPHIHFEIYSTLTDALDSSSVGDYPKVSQLALPLEVCHQVYNSVAGYSTSITNLSRITLASDNVFSDDQAVRQVATVTGSVGSMSVSDKALASLRATIGERRSSP
mgnify:CR=1 FL=1